MTSSHSVSSWTRRRFICSGAAALGSFSANPLGKSRAFRPVPEMRRYEAHVPSGCSIEANSTFTFG